MNVEKISENSVISVEVFVIDRLVSTNYV